MHRVLLGQHSTDSWYAECADCDWCWCVPGTTPDAMHEAAEQHGEIVPGGYMPRAYVEALVLAVMEPPPAPGTEGE